MEAASTDAFEPALENEPSGDLYWQEHVDAGQDKPLDEPSMALGFGDDWAEADGIAVSGGSREGMVAEERQVRTYCFTNRPYVNVNSVPAFAIAGEFEFRSWCTSKHRNYNIHRSYFTVPFFLRRSLICGAV